jgi:hypothetical protein
MEENEIDDQLTDVFIQVNGSSTHLFNELVKEINIHHGQVRHAFSPEVIFASLPSWKIEELLGSNNVAFLTREAIDKPPPSLSADKYREIILVWNKHTEVRLNGLSKTHTGEDQSWDTPGYLPPDPPAHFRKMMRDWENNMDKLDENQ